MLTHYCGSTPRGVGSQSLFVQGFMLTKFIQANLCALKGLNPFSFRASC